MKENVFDRILSAIMLRVLSKQLIYHELHRQIMEKTEISILFPEEKIIAYQAHEPIKNTADHPGLYITQLRYYWMYAFLKTNYPEIFNPEIKILKVGDPSGNLLQALGKSGTSININQECISFLRNKRIEAMCGNAEQLPYEDSSFDYIFSFQCLEHIPNPIKALNEFGRVARKKVFISIPYIAVTKIYNLDYWLKELRDFWGIEKPKKFDGHIFEFSTEDFKNILSHTNLEYEDNFLIYYFDNNTFLRRLLNKCIKSYFNFFVLKPRKNNEKRG